MRGLEFRGFGGFRAFVEFKRCGASGLGGINIPQWHHAQRPER